jgi:hypothetical protein
MKGGESDGMRMREKPQRHMWVEKDHEEEDGEEKITTAPAGRDTRRLYSVREGRRL